MFYTDFSFGVLTSSEGLKSQLTEFIPVHVHVQHDWIYCGTYANANDGMLGSHRAVHVLSDVLVKINIIYLVKMNY